MKRIFDVPRVLADARAGTLSPADVRKAIEKADAWGLSDAALKLREFQLLQSAGSRTQAPRPNRRETPGEAE